MRGTQKKKQEQEQSEAYNLRCSPCYGMELRYPDETPTGSSGICDSAKFSDEHEMQIQEVHHMHYSGPSGDIGKAL